MWKSAAYFLVLLHIMIKENTNFALFTLEVMAQKGQKKWFFYQKAILHLLLIPPVERPFTSFTEHPSQYPEILESEGGMWLPPHSLSCWELSTSSNHQFSEPAEPFCFIPSSYMQEKPEFQQNLFCDVFLDLRSLSWNSSLITVSKNFMYTQSSPSERSRSTVTKAF